MQDIYTKYIYFVYIYLTYKKNPVFFRADMRK